MFPPHASDNSKGKVTFEGRHPSQGRPIDMNADPFCVAAHSGKKVFSENYVIDDNGGVQWVFIYIKEGLEGKTFKPPTEPVVFSQHGCTFKPHVFGIQVGQPLEIKNDDATLHNVHILAKKNKEMNVSTPFQGFKLDTKFDTPEVMVAVKCDVHKWMSAYCGVLDHPFFATTGPDGSYEIKDVPAGKYKLAFWHRRLGEKVFDVTVGDGDTEQDLTYTKEDVPKRKKRHHRRKKKG